VGGVCTVDSHVLVQRPFVSSLRREKEVGDVAFFFSVCASKVTEIGRISVVMCFRPIYLWELQLTLGLRTDKLGDKFRSKYCVATYSAMKISQFFNKCWIMRI